MQIRSLQRYFYGKSPIAVAENFQLIRENSLFGPEYYRTGFGGVPYERSTHWLNFFRGVADRIVDTLAPRRVLDAGCAWGMLVEALRDRGTDAHGVDISEFAISGVRPDIRRF